MKVAVTGASGLIGSALVPALRDSGHEVSRLVRRKTKTPDEVRWDPAAGTVDMVGLQGVEAVIHLAGAGVGDRRWTAAYKREIRDSRVQGTTTISRAIAELDPRPQVLLSASAIGWYGDTGDRAVDESEPAGSGFLAEIAREWEASTAAAEDAGIRVAHLRTGLVVARHGGAWQRLFPIFRLGLGGKLGSGQQYWSFISLEDEVGAIRHLLTADSVHGPVNLTAPRPVTNDEVTRAMGWALHRPTAFSVPGFALKLALGELGEDTLRSQRVLPRRLLASGYEFRHPDIESTLAAALQRRPPRRA